jgi:hypothetical protein
MVEYNPFNHAMVDDAFQIYEQLRDSAPVYHNADVGFYALSRYEDVVNAHLDVETFSSTHGVTIEGIDAASPFLIVKDPPEHSWHRKIVAKVFTPRGLASSSRSSDRSRLACSTRSPARIPSTSSPRLLIDCRWMSSASSSASQTSSDDGSTNSANS